MPPNSLMTILGNISSIPDALQGDTEQNDIMGPSLPFSDAPLDPPSPVNGIQAAQISQLAININRERKIKEYSSLHHIPIHKAHWLISSDNA